MGPRLGDEQTHGTEGETRYGAGRYGDDGGLYLNVRPNGSRAWLLRYTLPGGRTRDMGLGSLANVTLAEARDAAARARERIRAGVDPIQVRGETAADATVAAMPAKTFRDLGKQYVRAQESGWKNPVHRAQWRSTLETYASPILGGIPIGAITTSDVLEVLAPIWIEKNETASRLRGRIERILAAAKALGLRFGDNPAAWKENLDALLAPAGKVKKKGHHKSLEWKRCPDFAVALEQQGGSGARALLLTMLTATRTSETPEATWKEFDLAERGGRSR